MVKNTVILSFFLLLISCATTPEVTQANFNDYKNLLTTAPSQEVLKSFDYDLTQDLNSQAKVLTGNEIEIMVNRDLICEEISFASPWGDRIPGFLFRPRILKTPAPAVLVLSGRPGLAQAANSFAGTLARLGMVTLTLSSLPARLGHEKSNISGERWHQEAQIAQIRDFRRALDYLQSRPEVDPKRLGVTGNSAGGFAGVSLTGVEPRVKAFLFQIAAPSPFMVGVFQGNKIPVDWVSYDGLPLTHVPRTAPILWQNQLTDPLVKKEFAEETIGMTGGISELRWYPGNHSTNAAMNDEGAQWLFEKLK